MRVAILGCGYVGCELGSQLLGMDSEHEIWGVRRSANGLDSVREAGLIPVEADVTDADSLSSVPEVDWVVFAASAGGRESDAARETYVEGLHTAIEAFGNRDSPPDRFVYTGSTGVYGDFGGDWVDEETTIDPETERQAILLEAERVAIEASAEYGLAGTVARFGGLYGPGRYRVARYVEQPVTAGYLNLIHRADAAGATAFLLCEDHGRGAIVNVVDDEPIDKHDLADYFAAECGVAPPEKRTIDQRLADADLSPASKARIQANKRCSNAKLRGFDYEFTYPTYRDGYREAIDAYEPKS